MGCADCHRDLKELQQALFSITSEAKKYAIENEKTVYIYQTENGWSFMEEEQAIENNIQPTGGVVSHYKPASA